MSLIDRNNILESLHDDEATRKQFRALTKEQQEDVITEASDKMSSHLRLATDIANSCVEFLTSRSEMVNTHPALTIMLLHRLLGRNVDEIMQGNAGMSEHIAEFTHNMLDSILTDNAFGAPGEKPRD